MFRLLATYGNEISAFYLPEGDAHLGTAPQNDLVVPARGVSRRHAIVRRCPGGVEVLDLGSKNGLYVETRRVPQAVLTPGLRVQVGAAWLELEELSNSEAEIALLLPEPPNSAPARMTDATASTQALPDEESVASPKAALRLAYYIESVGVGVPGERVALLARVRRAIGAEAIGSVERTRRGRSLVREADGLLAEEHETLALLTDSGRPSAPGEVWLRRTDYFLLAGRDRWYIAARFAEPAPLEPWRRDFLRYLAACFFDSGQGLKELRSAEVMRVLALVGGNISEAARRLGVQRPTIYKILERAGLHPRKSTKK
jgi:hypothetical protein